MYCGKITFELEELYQKYKTMFGVEPDYYEEVDYGDDYDGYVADIGNSLKTCIQLPELYA